MVKDGKILSIVQDYDTSDDSMEALQQALVFGGIGTVALVALVSVILAGSLSRRIVAVAGTARRIAAGDLDASAADTVGKGKDEVQSLATALDTMATSLTSGTLRSLLGVVPSRAATMALDTRFFAPRTVTVPSSGLPPRTAIAVMASSMGYLSGYGVQVSNCPGKWVWRDPPGSVREATPR